MIVRSLGAESQALEPPATHRRGADDLLPIVYERLCQIAKGRLADESCDHSLQTLDLVHETYLRLAGGTRQWTHEGQFVASACDMMRRILVDRARKRHRIKRGGKMCRVPLVEGATAIGSRSAEVLIVDDLFDELHRRHPREADVVRLHYFGGLTISEAGRALGIPSSTAHRYWAFARAWLRRAFSEEVESS